MYGVICREAVGMVNVVEMVVKEARWLGLGEGAAKWRFGA
jgi:hypothetical protein